MKFYSGTWPVLQSSTEVKHASGLLSVSAQFVCPSNNIVMPTSIPSSAGAVTNIYPPPSVSIQDGLAIINATGYKKWGDIEETIKNIVLIVLVALEYTSFYGTENFYYKSIKVPAETATVKKIGGMGALPTTPTLSLFGKQTWNVGEVFGTEPVFWPTGNYSNISPILTTEMTSLRSNNFGNLVELEATYELRASINFGFFSTEEPPEIPEITE